MAPSVSLVRPCAAAISVCTKSKSYIEKYMNTNEWKKQMRTIPSKLHTEIDTQSTSRYQHLKAQNSTHCHTPLPCTAHTQTRWQYNSQVLCLVLLLLLFHTANEAVQVVWGQHETVVVAERCLLQQAFSCTHTHTHIHTITHTDTHRDGQTHTHTCHKHVTTRVV